MFRAALLLVIILGGFIFVTALVFLGNHKNERGVIIATPSPKLSSIPVKLPKPTPSSSVVTMQTVVEDKFTIKIPESWKIEKTQYPGDLQTILFYLPSSTADEYMPHVYVRLLNKNDTENLTRSHPLSTGYAKVGTVNINGLNAVIYQLTAKGADFETGNPLHKNTLQAIYWLEIGDKVFMIDTAYYDDANAQQNEALITEIITSFKLRANSLL